MYVINRRLSILPFSFIFIKLIFLSFLYFDVLPVEWNSDAVSQKWQSSICRIRSFICQVDLLSIIDVSNLFIKLLVLPIINSNFWASDFIFHWLSIADLMNWFIGLLGWLICRIDSFNLNFHRLNIADLMNWFIDFWFSLTWVIELPNLFS